VALAEAPVASALRRRAYASGVWELVEGPPLRVSSYAPSLVPAVRRAVDDADAAPLLYVDSCREMTARMSELLVEEGYRVETAPGAAEAIRMMAQRPYALIVTAGDVLRAAARLQPGIPVIVLTASLEDDEFLRAVELGARGCLSKLAGPDRIVAEIRSAIVPGEAQGQPRRQGD
jgi:CheY-like chemotaxis protein